MDLIHKDRCKPEKFLSYGVVNDFKRHIDRLLNFLKLNMGLIHKDRCKPEKFPRYGVANDFTRHIDRLLNFLKLNNLMMKGVKMLSSFCN